MRTPRTLFVVLSLTALLCFPALAAADKPAPREISAEMSCGVCGMHPALFPDWQTQIIFTDGTMVPFDSIREMFKYLLNLERYNPGKSRADVAALWVRDRSSSKWIDGETAFYLVGGKVMGPMGRDLVPFADAEKAAELGARKGGTVMSFTEAIAGQSPKKSAK